MYKDATTHFVYLYFSARLKASSDSFLTVRHYVYYRLFLSHNEFLFLYICLLSSTPPSTGCKELWSVHLSSSHSCECVIGSALGDIVFVMLSSLTLGKKKVNSTTRIKEQWRPTVSVFYPQERKGKAKEQLGITEVNILSWLLTHPAINKRF